MCSYLGTFPPALAHSMIRVLSDEGDVVLDPFSGRGTTLLEARLLGRVPLASDLNPIAVALSRAKNVGVEMEEVLERLAVLERRYDPVLFVPEAEVQGENILLIYHPHTLAQLVFLRRRLVGSPAAVDQFLVGAVLGIMHGGERQDGTSGYASISMPNTFSMSPDYVRRFVETKRLQRVERNVFQILREKVERLFREDARFAASGVVTRADAKHVSRVPEFAEHVGNVQLVVTSPPYLGVVNYARQNWIRTWFLGEDPESVTDALDDNLTLAEWLDFSEAVVTQLKGMLRPEGVAVLVIGDVAKSSRTVVSLAREFIRRLLHDEVFRYVGCLSDRLPGDAKTTRIWGDTKGKATAVDRVVILSDATPEFQWDRLRGAFASVPDEIPKASARQIQEYAAAFAG